MTIQHYTAAEYIVSQSDRIEQLAADVRELRKANVMLAAINLKLPTADLSAADIAESLRLGCPQWREVAAILAPPCHCGQPELPPALEALKDLLTPTENRILRFLYQHLDKTIAADPLIHAAGMRNVEDMEAARNSLQVHINRLRNQLTRYSSPLWVYTVRGAGYRLEEVADAPNVG